MTRATLHFLVPDAFDDAERVSGGNVYDRCLAAALRARGVDVRLARIGADPDTDIARTLSTLPRDAVVLIDGLLAVASAGALRAQTTRLRIVVLAHMVAGALSGPVEERPEAPERDALHAARAVIATSEWTRSELIARGLAEPDRIAVAHPGADAVPAASGSGSGARLLCVGAVAPHKGQDVLVAALAGMADLPDWTCAIVGSRDADPDLVRRVSAAIGSAALEQRVALTGVLTGRGLDDAYRTADLVVAPSRVESYGMVVAEALARGIPVVASCVGGIPEAVAGRAAGVLIPPGDPGALRATLRRWLEDPGWRAALTADALRSRTAARTWDATAGIVAGVLRDVGRPVDALDDGRRAAG